MSIMFDSVLPTVIPIFAIIMMGYLLGRKTNYDIKFPTDVTVYFTLPCLIFSALAQKWDTPFLAEEFLVTGIGTVFIIFGTAGFVAIYLKCTKQENLKVFYPTVMFVNAGNLALALDYFAFGYDGFMRGVLFQLVNTSLLYTLGVYLIGQQLSFKKIFQFPFFYAAVAGTLIWVFHIELPGFVLQGVDFLGKAALPILILMLGYSLKNINLSQLSLALSGGAMRILGGLLIAVVFVAVIRMTGLVGNSPGDMLTLKVLIVNGSMPAALNIYLLAQKYNNRPDIVAPTVFASTVLGLITIPIVLWGVNAFVV